MTTEKIYRAGSDLRLRRRAKYMAFAREESRFKRIAMRAQESQQWLGVLGERDPLIIEPVNEQHRRQRLARGALRFGVPETAGVFHHHPDRRIAPGFLDRGKRA
ncbi:MAG: hypothetical protein ABIR29_02945 [Chthoniobacterales bacterium]